MSATKTKIRARPAGGSSKPPGAAKSMKPCQTPIRKEALQLGANLNTTNLPKRGSGINTLPNSGGRFCTIANPSEARQWGIEEAQALRGSKK